MSDWHQGPFAPLVVIGTNDKYPENKKNAKKKLDRKRAEREAVEKKGEEEQMEATKQAATKAQNWHEKEKAKKKPQAKSKKEETLHQAVLVTRPHLVMRPHGRCMQAFWRLKNRFMFFAWFCFGPFILLVVVVDKAVVVLFVGFVHFRCAIPKCQ